MPYLLDTKAARPIYFNNGAALQAVNTYEGKSAEFVRANLDYLFVPTVPDFTVGVGDFTIEFRLRVTSNTITQNFFDGRPLGPTNGPYPYIYAVSAVLKYNVSSADRISGGALVIGAWHHLAVCRSSGVTKMFLDGAQVGTDYTDATNYTNHAFFIGGTLPAASFMGGMIDHIRLTKSARYTSAFTPPTVMDETDPSWANVVFLAKFNDATLLTHHVGYSVIDNAIDLTGFRYQPQQPSTVPRRIAGTIKENGVPVGAGKRVAAFTRGTLTYASSCTTKADGTFEMTMLPDRTSAPDKLFVVAFDDDGVNPNYNAVIADQIEQEV